MINSERARGAASVLRCLSERLTKDEIEELLKLENKVFTRLTKIKED